MCICLYVCIYFKPLIIIHGKRLNSSIWPIDGTLTATTTLIQSWPGSNGSEGVLYIPQTPILESHLQMQFNVILWTWDEDRNFIQEIIVYSFFFLLFVISWWTETLSGLFLISPIFNTVTICNHQSEKIFSGAVRPHHHASTFFVILVSVKFSAMPNFLD